MDNRITGTDGGYFLEATTAHSSKKFSMIYMVSDAVFTTLSITYREGTVHNALLTTSELYGQNLAGRTCTQGTLISVPEGSWYSAVTMSSGTAWGVITRNQ